jgi:LysM repeat protein
VLDTTSINAWVRAERKNGRVTVTTPVAVTIISENPGVYAQEGVPDPRPGKILHYSGFATGTVSVDGTAKAGDIATVIIKPKEGEEGEERSYTYTVKEGDTLESIRDGLITSINDDPKVEAFPAGLFTRIRLRAREAGDAGIGIPYATKVNDGAQVILTATTPVLCCANVGGSPVTVENPALPGETIVLFATGLGLVKPLAALLSLRTGEAYDGPELNEPNEFVSSLAGGKTANVLFAGLKQGAVGVYEVHLELNSDLPTNTATQVTIAQDIYVSNIVALPVFNPNTPEEPEEP